LLSDAAQAFELEVRSHSQLLLQADERGRRPLLRGRIMDNVNQGVVGATLRLRIFPLPKQSALPSPEHRSLQPVAERELRSDGLGYFSFEPQLDDGRYLATVELVAAPLYEPTTAELPFTVQRHPLELELDAPRFVRKQAGLAVEFRARAAAPALAVEPPRLELSLEAQTPPAESKRVSIDTSGDELMLPWLSAFEQRRIYRGKQSLLFTQDQSGRFIATLSFPGNDYFEPARAQAELFLFDEAALSFEAQLERERDARGVGVSGRLLFDQNLGEQAKRPIDKKSAPGANVLIQVAQHDGAWRVIAELPCNDEGDFQALLPLERFPHGEVYLRATFAPDSGLAQSSDPLTLQLDPFTASSFFAPLLIVLGALLGLGTAFVYARGVWQRWRARRLRARLPQSQASISQVDALPGTEVPGFNDIIGVLFDATEGTRLSKGSVALLRPGRKAGSASEAEKGLLSEQSLDHQGRFGFIELPPGQYELRATAFGYVQARFRISLPLPRPRAWRVELVPVRTRAKELYRWMLAQYAPDEELWGRRTPRELAQEMGQQLLGQLQELRELLPAALFATLDEALGSGDGQQLLQALTSLFEELYYAQRRYPESVLALLESACRALLTHTIRHEEARVLPQGLQRAELLAQESEGGFAAAMQGGSS
jgi:hypothetical protein